MTTRPSAIVHNPLLALPSVQRLKALPPEAKAALIDVLIEIGDDTRARAEANWRKHKAPMAAYYKVTSVYARHLLRAVRR